MPELDYSQVDTVLLIDYESSGPKLEVALVGNVLYLTVIDYGLTFDGEPHIGVNVETLERAIEYLNVDNKELRERLNLPEWREPVKYPNVYLKPKSPTDTRPSWDEYAITLARAAATRSEDPYIKVGAVALREDHSVASLGYNGAPSGVELDWSNRDERRKRVLHAEANALRYVQPGELAGGMLATTHLPCLECLKAARAQGVTDVLYENDIPDYYNVADIFKIADEFGVALRKLNA